MAHDNHHDDHHHGHHHAARTFKVRVQRQENAHSGTHWETFELTAEEGMNITTVLQRIAADPVTVDHQATTPVAFDCCCLEEVCGVCTRAFRHSIGCPRHQRGQAHSTTYRPTQSTTAKGNEY